MEINQNCDFQFESSDHLGFLEEKHLRVGSNCELEPGAQENDLTKSQISKLYHCPLCDFRDESSDFLQIHVDSTHFESPSPSPIHQGFTNCESSFETFSQNDHTEVNALKCPLCEKTNFKSLEFLTNHVETHFIENQTKMMKEQMTSYREKMNFKYLQAHYGMTQEGNFVQQSLSGMEKAVRTGIYSISDYYDKKIDILMSEEKGTDLGDSVTLNLMPFLKTLSQGSRDVISSSYCSYIDHYTSTFGDKGWGCGYRNLQMLLSSIVKDSNYKDKINCKPMVSITSLQDSLEKAWKAGFDEVGGEQFGGRLKNTRKWIGATEIVTFLSFHNIGYQLLDFNNPSSIFGTHPQLFDWVHDYFTSFKSEKEIIHPLYLQQQGHSRTIVGFEKLRKNNEVRLLILDPSHSKCQMSELKKGKCKMMKYLRQNVNSLKAPQYQIVALRPYLTSEKPSKIIESTRIS